MQGWKFDRAAAFIVILHLSFFSESSSETKLHHLRLKVLFQSQLHYKNDNCGVEFLSV
jgi:hypothetical protein